MTLQAAIIAARRRVLRPEGYQQAPGVVFAFLLIAVVVRFAANIYIGRLLLLLNASAGGSGTNALSSAGLDRFFAASNLSWSMVFLATVAPMMAYRGIARTVRNPRLALAPLSRGRLLAATVGASYRSLPAAATGALALAAAALFLRAPVTAGLVELALFLLAGGAGFLGVLWVAWIMRAKERHLELIEIGMLAGMIFANPEFRITAGFPRIQFFTNLTVDEPRFALLFALPLLGAAAAAAMVVLAELAAGGRRTPSRRRRLAGLVLYRSALPVRLFVLTYAVELPVILTNPAVATTVRHMVLVLLCLRVVWFVIYVFRTEQEIDRIIGAPWTFADRFPLYRPAAGVHGLLCAFPVLLYLARVIAR